MFAHCCALWRYSKAMQGPRLRVSNKSPLEVKGCPLTTGPGVAASVMSAVSTWPLAVPQTATFLGIRSGQWISAKSFDQRKTTTNWRRLKGWTGHDAIDLSYLPPPWDIFTSLPHLGQHRTVRQFHKASFYSQSGCFEMHCAVYFHHKDSQFNPIQQREDNLRVVLFVIPGSSNQ